MSDTFYFRIPDGAFEPSGKERNLPGITDVKEYNKTAVIVRFSDGTLEKAVLQPPDVFSLEHGISICLTKRLLARFAENGRESALYNTLIRDAMKVYEKGRNEAKQRQDAENKRKEDNMSREKRLAEKREAAKKKKIDEAVGIYREAYIQAIKAISSDLRKSGGEDEAH